MIENLQREDLNPIEEAIAFQKLIKEYGLKQEEAAEKVSKVVQPSPILFVSLKLEDRVKQMIIDEMISSGHGRALLTIADPELQYTLAMKIFDNKLSVRETEKLIKSMLSEKKNAKPQTLIRKWLSSITSWKIGLNLLSDQKSRLMPKAAKKARLKSNTTQKKTLKRIVSLLETIK